MPVQIAQASILSPRTLSVACAWLLLAPLLAQPVAAQQPPGSKSATATTASAASSDVFSSAELDQMFASVALYPDPLLAQVLMASTYPGDVADAAKWAKAHPDAKGETAVSQVASQPWDPSVQALVAFPQLLASLGQDAAWVQRMGDAFLAQPDRVMDSVQRLRQQADKAGNLESNEYQRISKENSANAAAGGSTIIIEPSDPDVIYVPSYDPTVVYGSYGWGAYPPYYYPPGAYWYPGAALATGIMWGAAIGIAGGLWGDIGWGSGDIDIDVNNNFNREVNRGDRGDRGDRGERGDRGDRGNRGEGGKWQHNSANRDGTPYRDRASREQHGKQLGGAGDRSAFRGDTPQRSQARDQARQSMDRRGMDAPARDNRQAQDRARQANTGGGRPPGSEFQQRGQNNFSSRENARLTSSQNRGRNDAFSGSRNPGASRSASQRGNASRSMSRSGGSRGASRPMSRPASRGGGGRGGGGRRR